MKAMLSAVLVVCSIFFAISGNAASLSQGIPYYGEEFYKDLANGASNGALVARLQQILRGEHKQIPGKYDEVSEHCSGEGCYQHISLGYDGARAWLMGTYYLTQVNGHYAVNDVYCGVLRTEEEFPASRGPAPGKYPDGNILNTEHTWPQSRFSGQFNTGMQKSDLHHLYPTDNELNSIRGNYEFGEVARDAKKLKCPVSRFGKPAVGGNDVFEPPQAHKGNVARALFYFSVHYSLPISPRQEAFLRKWDKEDPVDDEEMARNNAIHMVQGNRNPFIDYPELTDKINKF
ncbi:endonuclease I family protein [Bdellovibrio sp. HCB288]|uniref:endonuclease I family protein n=1 Tax=Bdellovibrio sp. HCB288 TaxID=3394355 RepID=UPI0039B3BB9B